MLKYKTSWVILAGLEVFLLLGNSSMASEMDKSHNNSQTPSQNSAQQFQKIEQPLGLKAGITGAGLGLIGLDLWWFIYSKKSKNAAY